MIEATQDELIEEMVVDPTYDIRSDGTIWAQKPLSGPTSTKKTYPWRRMDRKTHGNEKYYVISYYGKQPKVSRIVYRKFNGSLDPELEINHKDGDKTNNRPENLELVTGYQNVQHSVKNNLHVQGEQFPQSKLTDNDVRQIRMLIKQGVTHAVLSKQFGVSTNIISHIRNGKTWKHVK